MSKLQDAAQVPAKNQLSLKPWRKGSNNTTEATQQDSSPPQARSGGDSILKANLDIAQISPLFKLPAEIRNAIYAMVSLDFEHCYGWCGKHHSANNVIQGPGNTKDGRRGNILVLNAHKPVHDRKNYSERTRKHIFAVPLLQVSSQIRKEAAAIHYGRNVLTIEVIDLDLKELFAWIAMLGPHSKLLRRLELNIVGSYRRVDFGEFLKQVGYQLYGPMVLIVGGRGELAKHFSKGWASMVYLERCGLKGKDIVKTMDNTMEMEKLADQAKPEEHPNAHLFDDDWDYEMMMEKRTAGREWFRRCIVAKEIRSCHDGECREECECDQYPSSEDSDEEDSYEGISM